MSDAADNAAEATVTTPGDKDRDETTAPDLTETQDTQAQLPSTSAADGDSAPKPKRRGRPPGSKNKQGTPTRKASAIEDTKPQRSQASEVKKLRKRLTGFLTGPALFFDAIGEKWPAEHIEGAAPDLSKQLIALAERDPAFARRLQTFLSGGETAGLVTAAVMYLAPVAIYFGAPFPEPMRRSAGIPRRQEMRRLQIPNREAIRAEALEHGFEDPDEYVRAARAAYEQAGTEAAQRVYRQEPEVEDDEGQEQEAEAA